MDRDNIVEILRKEILEGLTVHVTHSYDDIVTVILRLNGDIVSSDYFTLPSEG